MKWIEGIGARFGRVQLLRMKPNTMRECRWGLHLDNNNAAGNPETNGWVVRIWLELTDDASSALVVRSGPSSTARARSRSPCRSTSRPWSTQSSCSTAAITTAIDTRYAVIVSAESGPEFGALDRQSQLP